MDEQSIFLAALEQDSPTARTAYLDTACGRDADLRKRIDALLSRYDDAGSFLDRPPSELDATAMGVDDTHEDGKSASDVRTTLYDSSDDVSVDFLHPSAKLGCIGTIGQYEVQSIIGRGGMGVVLKAHDTKLHRTVAVKVLAPELAANPTAKQRFIREAKSAAAVTNPHVVTTHAVDEDRVPYMVMELVDGKTLREKIDAVGMLGVKEILRIGSQVAHGLAAAHKQGLIHRDIKPGNILLENGVERVKITDFGLARAVDDLSVTRTGEVAGTPQYMSPEQALGEGVDHRSDLFSLGSVMYAMCTGRPPFRGDNAMAVLRRVIDEPPRPIREVNADIPDWLCDIVNKLLAKKPEERYQTAKEVAGVLEESLARLQYPSHVTSAAPSSSRSAPASAGISSFSKRQWLVAAGIIGVLVVAAGIIIKITQPDGTTIEMAVDDGSRIQITTDDDSSKEAQESNDISGSEPIPESVSWIDLNGLWESEFGEIRFQHARQSSHAPYEVHGVYFFSTDGVIEGVLDPVSRSFRGRFREGDDEGRLWFDVSTDGQTIDGWYDYLNTEPADGRHPGSTWNMRRITSAQPASSSAHILTSPDWEWTEPENLGPAINTSSNEGGPTLTADGLTLMFHSNRAGGFGDNDLWMSTRLSLDAVWQPPVNLGPTINTESFDDNPSLSGDGLILVFHSSHDANGRSDLMMSTRENQAAPWSAPVNLGDDINSSDDDVGAALSADGLALVFGSDRNGEYELFSTWRPALDAPWSPAENLGTQINSPATQGFATLANDGLSLIFNSNRAGGNPVGPMWIATRPTTGDNWSAPVRLQPEEQRGAWSPCLSADNTIMLFDSRRAGGQGNGDFDLWMTRRVQKASATIVAPTPPPRSSADILTSADWEWTEPENLGRIFNSAENEGGPSLTADGLILVFHSTSLSMGEDDLWIATRGSTDQVWTATTNLGPSINSTKRDANPSISADGLVLVFESDRAGGLGGRDLWITSRPSRDDNWNTPVNLGEAVNSPGFDQGPALSPDCLSLVFAIGGGDGEAELWETSRPSRRDPWARVRRLEAGINSPAYQGWPTIAGDGLSLVFNSNRDGGPGPGALWIATRASTTDAWSNPIRLEHPDGTFFSPGLNSDGTIMVFDSPRDGGQGKFDIWMTRRVRKTGGTASASAGEGVFVEAPPLAIAPFDAEQARAHQIAWQNYLGVAFGPENTLGMQFVLIPPGEFMMGSTDGEIDWLLSEAPEFKDEVPGSWVYGIIQNEGPVRRVTIAEPYYMGATEVRVGDFRQFVNETGYQTEAEINGGGLSWSHEEQEFSQRPENVWSNPELSGSENLPVVFVTKADAEAFCNWLTEELGEEYRLPSEEEWEYACRAGTQTRWFFGTNVEDMQRYGFTMPHSRGETQSIARLETNPFGLFDVYGNVSELTLTPLGATIERGSAFGSGPYYARSASRSQIDPNEAWYARGFRVVKSIEPQRSDVE